MCHCAKIPTQKFPPNPRFNRPSANLPIIFPKPPPPVPLHSIRSAKAALPAAPIRRCRGSAILSLPQYALVDCRPLAAPPPLATFLWRRTAVSATTTGDVHVETHGGQLLPRYTHSRLRPRSCRCSAECWLIDVVNLIVCRSSYCQYALLKKLPCPVLHSICLAEMACQGRLVAKISCHIFIVT